MTEKELYAKKLKEKQPKWWKEAGLGMFVHFGPYAVYEGEYKGEICTFTAEWIRHNCEIPMAEYTETAQNFNPYRFDADKWIKTAKEAGVEYIVFTSKHHDGFANFRTEASDFSLWNYQKKDMVAQLSEACRKYGIRLGLYYSHFLDWHEKNGGGGQKMVHEAKGWKVNNAWDWETDYETYDFKEYFYRKSLPQIKELLTNYGKVDIIWFDCPFGITREEAMEVHRTVKELQPDCLINSRIYEETFEFADFWGLGDNSVSAKPTESRTESIITLNQTWGYNKHDNNWKTSQQVLATLAKSASANSNLMINVGPKPDGTWPEETENIFKDMAEWMKTNRESVFANDPLCGTKMNPMNCEDFVFTRRDNNIYLHFLADISEINLYNLKTKVREILPLGNACNIEWSQDDDYKINIKCKGKTALSVLKIVCDGEIKVSDEINELNHAFSLNAVNGTPSEKIKDSINEQNTITDWKDPDQNITWDIICKEPGEYRATLITVGEPFAKWVGGHRVYLTANGRKYQSCEVKNDGFDPASSGAWETVRTDLGEITLDKAGENTVSISADYIKEDCGGFRFTKLILEKA